VAIMTEREYLAVCSMGHRTYLLLRFMVDPPEFGRCATCGRAAMLYPVET